MRNTSFWSEKLRKALRNSEELEQYVADTLFDEDLKFRKKEIARLAQLIVYIELGLTLLREIAPSESADAVSSLLSGYRFPVASLQSEENWRKVQIARFYLIRLKGELWEQSLEEYIRLPEGLKIFQLSNVNDVAELNRYTTICPNRHNEYYLAALTKTPPHSLQKIKLASEGSWYAKISVEGNSPEEVPIYIPASVNDIATNNLVYFHRTRQTTNPSCTVTRTELLQAARAMDRCLEEKGQPPQNYHQRLSEVIFRLYDSESNDFQIGERIPLDTLIHIVGLLNVGKTLFLQVTIYFLAQQGYRCALVVDNVVSQVRLASLFWFGLDIPAVPIMGNDRAGHLQKVYEPVLLNQGEEIYKGGIHPAHRWFSSVCPLLGLVKSETRWKFGDEPCHKLYQKDFVAREKDDKDIEIEEEENEEFFTCPFYCVCPRHQLEKDTAQAMVWVLTPASLIHSRVPRQVFDINIRFTEAVYRECNYLFTDETDRVQVQLDEDFAPDEVLVDNSPTGLLNKLGSNINQIYRSNRTSMTADLFESWTNAQYDVQKAINKICPILYQQEKLVNWLGDSTFRGRSLFNRLIGELINPNTQNSNNQSKLTRTQRNRQRQQTILQGLFSPQQKQRQKELTKSLESFLQAPLDTSQGDKLTNIALNLLGTDNEKFVFEEIEKWWKDWLKAQKIPKPDDETFEQLKRKTYFAILITVLENRLIFVVDRMNLVSRLIDLHELRQWLVNRPPYDYIPIVPNSPVGNILGFKYTRDRLKNRGGKLEYFRYVGVGRYLLLNFPKLFAVDGLEGPHTILISGTSYAPGSPAYHIKQEPTILLEPANNNHKAGDAGIAESEFYFTPRQRKNGKYIAISGLLPDARKKADEEIIKIISYAPGKTKNFLDSIFAQLEEKQIEDEQKWRDRSRILVINGSYNETELINASLIQYYKGINREAIQPLIRDNNPSDYGIPRGKIEGIKDTKIKILSVPMMAFERGYNVLNKDNIAAFGAGIFINRSMPVPDDWQTTVRQLNAWTLDNVENPEFYQIAVENNLSLSEAGKIFYGLAVDKMIDLNCRAMSYKQLTQQERSILCWNQLISMWQVIGRLVRGGVPCLIYFLDIRFADNFAEEKKDNETTSLLVGIIKELEKLMESDIPYQTTLARSLYGAFLEALKNTHNLDYEILNNG